MNIPRRTITGLAAVLLVVNLSTSYAQESQEAEPQSTRQAPAVGRSVYDLIEKSRVLLEEEKFAEAVELLHKQIARDNSEYELANLYQYLGYAHHSADDTVAAINAFSEVIRIQSIEDSMRKNVLYTLAQLLAMEERFDESLAQLDKWYALEASPTPASFAFYAQSLYQLGRYEEMIAPIEQALAIARERNMEPKEEWYALLGFAYYQQEDYEKIRDVSEILIVMWPKKRYWLYLANAYRELDDEERFFSSWESLYLQDYLETESELVTMAQLYLQQDVPYKAARMLEDEMERGRIEKDAGNYKLLSQAWYLAREDDRSIDPLQTAAGLEDDGNLYVRLANAYLNLRDDRNCIEAAKAGLGKGGLQNEDQAQMTLGMCLYNGRDYESAIRAFEKASKASRSAAAARQWIGIADLEIRREKEIAAAEELAVQRIQELQARRAAAGTT